MIKNLLFVLLFLFIFILLVSFMMLPQLSSLNAAGRFTMLSGFALLSAFIGGKLFSRFGFPKIVGYLVVGILYGPSVLKIFNHSDISNLNFVVQVSLGLIAVSAGSELKISEIKKTIGTVIKVISVHLAILPIVLGSLSFVLLKYYFSFTGGEIIIVSVLMGLVLTTASPAVPMAMISEFNLEGIFPRLTITILVIRDILIILFFSLILSISNNPENAWMPLVKISLSIGIGLLLGYLFSKFVSVFNSNSELFLIVFLLLIYKISIDLNFDYLILTLSIGFAIENYSTMGEKFLNIINQSSMPLYALFFSLAGASLEIDALHGIGFIALLIVIVRIVFLYISTYLPMKTVKTELNLKHYLFAGFVPQAGVSIGLALLLVNGFPQYKIIGELIIASAVFNEIIGPFIFKFAINQYNNEVN